MSGGTNNGASVFDGATWTSLTNQVKDQTTYNFTAVFSSAAAASPLPPS